MHGHWPVCNSRSVINFWNNRLSIATGWKMFCAMFLSKAKILFLAILKSSSIWAGGSQSSALWTSVHITESPLNSGTYGKPDPQLMSIGHNITSVHDTMPI